MTTQRDTADRLAELAQPHMESAAFKYDDAARRDVIRLGLLAAKLGDRDVSNPLPDAPADAVEKYVRELLGEPG